MMVLRGRSLGICFLLSDFFCFYFLVWVWLVRLEIDCGCACVGERDRERERGKVLFSLDLVVILDGG
jgi:hypothetical protein